MIARGTITGCAGGVLFARLPAAALGDGVAVTTRAGVPYGTLTALRASHAVITPHGSIDGAAVGDRVCADASALSLPLGTTALGRAFDPHGQALDGAGALRGRRVTIECGAPSAADRRAVTEPLWTGVRAIDGLLTIGRGARVGVFGAPGVGKSMLLEAIVSQAQADCIVLGLIGERGREAERWIARCDARTTIVCATSDRCAAERARAAQVAMAQACALRDRGLHVLLILDSLARYGAAIRELAVAAGESTGRAGYPASVFSNLAHLVEGAGHTRQGSITLLATVLSDGDERDPLSDAARSLLDGHIALSPELAAAGRFPAIDVPASASRTMLEVADETHVASASRVRAAIAVLAATADARMLGIAPVKPLAVRAAAAEADIERFLRTCGPADPHGTRAELTILADTL